MNCNTEWDCKYINQVMITDEFTGMMERDDRKMYIHRYVSPLGSMTMSSDGRLLTGLWFDGQRYAADITDDIYEEGSLPVFELTDRWLEIYFSGRSPDFMPPMKLCSTEFRQSVWNVLLKIPYGKTMTYGEIAGIIAEEKGILRMSAQAVGGAVGHNPIAIIIPCHRVVGADGSLTGYAGGLVKKAKLLGLEGVKL